MVLFCFGVLALILGIVMVLLCVDDTPTVGLFGAGWLLIGALAVGISGGAQDERQALENAGYRIEKIEPAQKTKLWKIVPIEKEEK